MLTKLLVYADAVGTRLLPFGRAEEPIPDEAFSHRLAVAGRFQDGFRVQFDVGGKTVLEIGSGIGAMQVELLRRGVARTFAVDVDAGYLAETRERVKGDPRLEVVHSPIENCPVADNDVDVVVSEASFEHVSDVPRALRETKRMLRPGGLVFIKLGQPWLHFNGPHLITYLHIPWVHLLFPERTIRAVLDRYKREGRYPARMVDARIADLNHMNRLTLRGYRSAFVASGLEVLQFELLSPRKQMIQRTPLLRELFAGTAHIVLRKSQE